MGAVCIHSTFTPRYDLGVVTVPTCRAWLSSRGQCLAAMAVIILPLPGGSDSSCGEHQGVASLCHILTRGWSSSWGSGGPGTTPPPPGRHLTQTWPPRAPLIGFWLGM